MATTIFTLDYDVVTEQNEVTTVFSNDTSNTTVVSVTESGDTIRHVINRVNLIFAGVLTSFGPMNMIILWSLLKFCPVRRTFNMYAVLICIADLVNNTIVGPLYLATWTNPQLLTMTLCKARLFIRVLSQFLTLAVALLLAVTRLLSAVNSRIFKKFLQIKAVVGSVIVIEGVACILGVQLIADDGQAMMVCLQRVVYRGVPRSNYTLSVILWVALMVAVVLCYISLVIVLQCKKMKVKQLPGNQHMVLVTFKIGLCISMVYFIFVFIPIFTTILRQWIYSKFNLTDNASLHDRLALGELYNTIVLLHSCINPLLYILPSSHFRNAFCGYFKKKCFCFGAHHSVAPSVNEQDSSL